ncbi:PTS system, sucrose-specific, IIBC component [Bacillus thuringiensis serovar huazhongensis BGSC 4BD1]|nr:PTS system, sucrose-specific, IIBC component [Bacillus thuringiensis serovar huazhongensis BGSC 4BD1]
MCLFPHTKNTSIKIITDTYDLERCFLSSHSQDSLQSNNITAGNLDSNTWQQYVIVFNVIKNAIFSYLVIYVGINAAKEFGGTPSLGGVIGGVTLLTGVTSDIPINNIFNGEPLSPGQGGVLGVLLAVWILSIFEKQLRKFVPDAVDIIVICWINYNLLNHAICWFYIK